jgi:hypothetical protein
MPLFKLVGNKNDQWTLTRDGKEIASTTAKPSRRQATQWASSVTAGAASSDNTEWNWSGDRGPRQGWRAGRHR